MGLKNATLAGVPPGWGTIHPARETYCGGRVSCIVLTAQPPGLLSEGYERVVPLLSCAAVSAAEKVFPQHDALHCG